MQEVVLALVLMMVSATLALWIGKRARISPAGIQALALATMFGLVATVFGLRDWGRVSAQLSARETAGVIAASTTPLSIGRIADFRAGNPSPARRPAISQIDKTQGHQQQGEDAHD